MPCLALFFNAIPSVKNLPEWHAAITYPTSANEPSDFYPLFKKLLFPWEQKSNEIFMYKL